MSPSLATVTLTLHVCPVCGHTVDVRDSTSTRGCFGKGQLTHPRSDRVAVGVDVVLDDVGDVIGARSVPAVPPSR